MLLVTYLVRSPSQPHAVVAAATVASSLRAAQRDLASRFGAEPVDATLSGRVHANSAAIDGALVCAACAGCEGTSAAAAPCTTTSGDGSYAFTELAAGAYFVHATAAGYLPGSAAGGEPIVLAAGEARSGVDVALKEGGARLAGHVIDATGGAVPHARVRAVRTIEPRISLDVVTDDAGRFELSLRPGFILLVAEAEGYASARVDAVAPRDDLSLMLTPAAEIAGTVVSARDDRPVAGIEVRAAPVRNRNTAVFRSALSDAQGRFSIRGLTPDAYQLVARGGRYYGESQEIIELGLAQRATDLRVRVEEAAEVIGRVVEAGGAPCQQGFASLGAPDPQAPLPIGEVPGVAELAHAVGPEQVADIQGDGTVHFQGVPPADYFVTIRCRERVLREGPRFLEVRDARLTGLSWTVSTGAALLVKVVDAQHRPLPATRFMLTKPRGTDNRRPVTVFTTDDAGGYLLSGLRAGTYGVGRYDGQVREPEVSVEVREEASTTEVELVVPGSGTILVEAKTTAGAPVNELHVTASAVPLDFADSTPVTKVPADVLGDGRFRIGPLLAGRYVISADDGINPGAQRGDDDQEQVVVRDGEVTHAVLVLDRAGSIGGVVLDANGAPAPDVWVSAEHSASSPASPSIAAALSGASRRVLTDLEGRFTLDGLAAQARYTVRALDPGGSAVVARDVAPSDQLALRLLAPGSIAGVVVDRSGQPITQFGVLIKNRDTGSALQRNVSDLRGYFSVYEIAPGPLDLTFWSASGESTTRTIELAPGQRLNNLSVVLEQDSALAATESPAKPEATP
jgi:hypothetical protein